MRRRVLAFALALAACSTAAAPTATTVPPDASLVEVAGQICPVLWRWQLSVGQAMNDMSHAAFREPDPARRLELYREGIDRARDLNRALRDEVTSLTDGPYVDLLVTDVLDGLAMSNAVLDEIEVRIEALHRAQEPTYREVVPGMFLEVEKVIDLPKPELADYHDEELIRAFVSVPQCQHGVKDANDGVPRYVPAA